ncbi:MAG TPA: TraB/GumN family protein, partial [Niastella sp.]|nr:TraB/GumN family protein [Niastella sp.]
MFFIRYACCLLTVCIIATCTYGQRTYPNSLLWRITGKGLRQPSYLFGTIHLTDKRLFKLGDSVYNAIEGTEGLAIEVNPDEMGAYYINKAINDAEGAKLQELLNEKDFKRYSSALAKKFKKPAAEITTGDIVTAKNKWMADYLEKGEMATFLDAYLYNIARRQGKWVGGVEDITDQTGILDDLVDKSDIDMLLATDTAYVKKAADNMMEHMAEMYMNQDLSGIEAITMTGSAQFHDLLMIKRNVKMARRIDSLTALRTMFIAVGAAHLPGDSGVIHLLQTRGFTVEPVFSSKKIDASNYTFKEVKLPWAETEDKQGLYKVAMPGNAIDIKLYGIIDLKFMFDVFTLSNYCTMSVVSPRSTIINKDSMLQELAQRMFQTTEKITAKKVTNSGIEGKEYIHTLMGQRIRMQAFIHDNIAYVAYMNAVKKEMLNSDDAERFFTSFTITKKQLAAAGDHPFVDSVMGVSLVSPAELSYNKKLSSDSDGWHISAFAGADISGGRYVMLFSKDISPGLYLSNDTAIQHGLVQSMSYQYPQLKVDSINLQGYNGIVLKGANAEQKGFYMQAVSLIKNNRNIVLLVVCDSAQMQSPETQKIFNSFQLITPVALPWQLHTTADSLFSARVPSPFRTWNTDGNHYTYSFDTTTASTYFIMPDTLGKYVWFENDSLFWNNTVTRYSERYKLIKKTNILYNNAPAMELLVKEDAAYKRMRLILHDDKVIQVMTIGDSNFVYTPNATVYLNSFRMNLPQQNSHFITQSKTPLLLQDIASKDSTVRAGTGTALYSSAFHKQDIPLLHEALFKPYLSLYNNEEDTYTNMRLAMILGQLEDSGTISFIREKYPLLTGEKEMYRNAALATLANLFTKESYATFAQLIEQYGAPKEAIDLQSIASLKDSLALTATIFNTLQKLAKDSTHG